MIWERWDSPRAPKGGQSGKESGGRSEPHGQEVGVVGGIKIYLDIIC